MSGSDGGFARFVSPEPMAARLEAPLQRAGETIGLLLVGSRRERGFEADEAETLSSPANEAAIAIENARLQARLRELAVDAERERIAREMHDGLAQMLGQDVHPGAGPVLGACVKIIRDPDQDPADLRLLSVLLVIASVLYIVPQIHGLEAADQASLGDLPSLLTSSSNLDVARPLFWLSMALIGLSAGAMFVRAIPQRRDPAARPAEAPAETA